MSVDSGDKGSWKTEHLPPSWRWVSFNEFWSDYTDSKRKIPQNSYLAEGAFPVIDQGASLIGGYANDSKKKSLAPLPVVIFGDHTRAIKYFDRPFIQGADGVRILCAAHGVDPLFAYHSLRCVQLPDKGYSRHFRFLKATQFPLAPLRSVASWRRSRAFPQNLVVPAKTSNTSLGLLRSISKRS